MTATDELRRLLDERGAEWIGTSFSTPTKGHPTNTSLGEEHHEATFIEYDDGNVLRLFDLTPEQAVEATLGSDIKAENEKLRELCADLYDHAAFSIDYFGDAHGILPRMRELGIEVDG